MQNINNIKNIKVKEILKQNVDETSFNNQKLNNKFAISKSFNDDAHNFNQEYYEDLVKETLSDFEKRQQMRKPLELQWRLNMNFLCGNQFAEITANGDVNDFGKQYFWQSREVFNHIAPIIETRLAKLNRVKSKISVRPFSNDDSDINTSKLSTKILASIMEENKLSDLLSLGNLWCEVTGSCFYKVIWDSEKGAKISANGKSIKEGDVSIVVCPPYEIYPDNITTSDLEDCKSIIHAKAYSVEDIKDIWNIDVKGEAINVFSLDNTQTTGGLGYSASVPNITSATRDNQAIVIEKYVLPSNDFPNGRLIIVAGEKLAYLGDLPYENGANNTRTYPFARQFAIENVGAFFGTSVIERVIPIQRAYNNIKNRKHEFLNRIAMGVLAVEDGSIDLDNIEEEGISPGKILVFRQGTMPPTMLNMGDVPSDFNIEEQRLLEEFSTISGVSEFMKMSKIPSNLTSGVALSIIAEQDDTRISTSASQIRCAVKKIGQQVLRLCKQFVQYSKLKRITGDNGDIEMQYFKASDLQCEDLVFDTENELTDTPANRKNMVLELLKLGLLSDENGQVTSRTKLKVLEMLGFGNWENGRDLDEYHQKKAIRENKFVLESKTIMVSDIDNHQIHIDEHIKALLDCDSNFKETQLNVLKTHILQHKQQLRGDNYAG